MSPNSPSELSPGLLTKALFRAVEHLGLAADLPKLLGAAPADVAELQSGARVLDPQRPEWSGALKLVGMFRTIVEVLGSVERAKLWLSTSNETLGGRPIDLLATADADSVHRYLSSVRKHELRMPPPVRQEH
ncbi:MbcA/ParS/Xre antitoxin family protein [Steroidobacter sp.]|uniref:MbcA/ParS/Xre antitoxin family protein n=1 Tax=Steroidobacter sp. TaxID=1978227 RepID=UPI001A592DF2|nr:MbcA/ParS/Xre antitoxin family protein [Steroidobacter sp.]MBL8268024.1 DUF2384 domain-containing protein [Steroidobacter sp.]